MYLFYAFLSAIFAGLVAIFAKLGLKNIDSTLATGIRSIIMAIFLAGLILLTNKFNVETIKQISTKDWILIILSGIAGAMSWIFYFYALKTSGDSNTSKVVGIDKLSLVFVAVFAVLILKEKLEWNGVVGIILMAFGAILLSVKL